MKQGIRGKFTKKKFKLLKISQTFCLPQASTAYHNLKKKCDHEHLCKNGPLSREERGRREVP
jgi:hypothetical protein